ncbi:hypothetical protein [Bacillus sp. B15-48]|uniref:hypothetical protein n=1 Tax=Bacillus sp. B15-48 TaxID=1548601 RepID=UPI00193F39C0|nr:hypothetical protein [Bacillus sp. B15-48]MBM4762736.1 hypothetical protein [Bacillus sp. B15-48]
MGILRDAMKLKPRVKRSSPAAIKRQIVLDELIAMNVTVTREGELIEELSYERLKEELVLASFRQIDIQNDQNKWF